MKKIWIGLFVLLFLTGCMNKSSASDEVKKYLNSYKNLDGAVLADLEDDIEREELTENQQKVYREILKKQYKDLNYKIEKEEVKDDKTYVTVKINVYDLYKSQSNSAEYLSEHISDFYNDEGKYDSSKYIDYKFEQMKNMSDRVEYTIVFTVLNQDDKYVVEQPSETDLEKMHGVYSYDVE